MTSGNCATSNYSIQGKAKLIVYIFIDLFMCIYFVLKRSSQMCHVPRARNEIFKDTT